MYLSRRQWQAIWLAGALTAFSSFVAADSADEKALKRAETAYAKYIAKAENRNCHIKNGKFKGCQREVNALDKRYAKYSDSIKSAPSIIELNQRHQQLKQVLASLEHQSVIKKVAQKYQLSIKRMETQSCIKKEYYMGPEAVRCHKDLLKADAARAGIPQNLLNEPVIADLVNRHEAMRNMPAYIQQVATQNRNALAEKASLHIEFSERAKNLGHWHELNKGKNKVAGTLYYLNQMNNDLSKYQSFAQDCQGKYATYIANKANEQYLCELAKNAQSHIQYYAAATYKVFLETETKNTQAINTQLSNEGYISHEDYQRLVVDTPEYVQNVINRVSDSHQKVNLPSPDFAAFKAAVAQTPKALKIAIANNSWDKKNAISVSSEIERSIQKIAENRNMELVEAGRKDAPWLVIKNEIGVPLRKASEAWMMVKAPGESFCRIIYTELSRTFDGSDYQAISDIDVSPNMEPAPCS